MSQTLFCCIAQNRQGRCRKRARADMESAPTFFVPGGEGRAFPCCVCRGDHWSPANLPPQRIFRDSCLVRQAGTGEQCSPLQEFSPVWARNIPARRTVLSPTACGRSPLAEGAKRERCPAWSFLPLVENEIRRGAFYMRPRKFALPQAGTGGYGIRPYVFFGGWCPRAEGGAPRGVFSLWSKARFVGAHSICARGSLSCRKRARADMESAPTFFLQRQPPRRGGQGARFCLLCVQADLFVLSPCQKPSYVVYYFSTSPQANPVQTGDAKL